MHFYQLWLSIFFVCGHWQTSAGSKLGRFLFELLRPKDAPALSNPSPILHILPPEEYSVGRVLGRGTFARVFEVTHLSTNQRYAAKVMRMGGSVQRKLELKEEVNMMLSLDHPNILKLENVFEYNGNLIMLMEVCERGELFDEIRIIPWLGEERIKIYFSKIVQAVVHMHALNIMHRDLKLENVFLTASDDVKLGDFGFAIQLDSESKLIEPGQKRVGTPSYTAPEILADRSYGTSADVFSLGVVLFTMLVVAYPFETMAETVSGVRRPLPEYISSEAQDLVENMLKHDPGLRIKTNEILNHPWLRPQAELEYDDLVHL